MLLGSVVFVLGGVGLVVIGMVMGAISLAAYCVYAGEDD